MAYTYVIGVTANGLPKNVTLGPTLGAFTCQRDAFNHIELLKQDRKFHGCEVLWDTYPKWQYSGDSVRIVTIKHPQVYSDCPDGHTEYLQVQRYITK